MELTDEFSRTLKGICIAVLILIIPVVWMQSTGIYGISTNEPKSTSRFVFNQFFFLIPKMIFWYGVFYVTKDQSASLIAFCIELLLPIIRTLDYFAGSSLFESIFSVNILYVIFGIVGFAVFGWLHFKKAKGLYLALVAMITSGITYGLYSYQYYEIIESFFSLFGIDEFLSIRIQTSDTGYREIKLFFIFKSQLYIPLLFIIFWFIYLAIKKDEPFDFSLRTISIPGFLDKSTYALVHWILRLVLVVAIMGTFNFMTRFISDPFSIEHIIRILNFCFSAFVVAALYRNVLLSFYLTKKTYPSWLYIFLNIPYFHFVPWLILYFMAPRNKIVEQPVDILDAVELQNKDVPNYKESQRAFELNLKNNAIKGLFIVFLILGIIGQLAGLGNSMIGVSVNNQLLLIVFSIVSFLLTIWYMSDYKAVFFIFVLQSLSILLAVIFKHESIMGITAMAGLINLIIYYPLFHFDKMELKEVDLESL